MMNTENPTITTHLQLRLTVSDGRTAYRPVRKGGEAEAIASAREAVGTTTTVDDGSSSQAIARNPVTVTAVTVERVEWTWAEVDGQRTCTDERTVTVAEVA
ncbi:MAG TPA: hypothetical protein VMW08_00495 [Acidimicrobiales bacterium]|nr:hypothetical protein [Acidimicrobiales bacterium]